MIISEELKKAFSRGEEIEMRGAPPEGVRVRVSLLFAWSVISTIKESEEEEAEKETEEAGVIGSKESPTLIEVTLEPVPKAVAERTNSSFSLVSIEKETSGRTVSIVMERVAEEERSNLSLARMLKV